MATEEQLAALKDAVPAAQAAEAKYGVPASVTLAQWIYESSWGASKLAVDAHNYFGIKASHLSAPDAYVGFPTEEYVSGKKVLVQALFERYYDAADSFADHAKLLATAARYRMAMVAHNDPNTFAFCLQRAGYSTNPAYAADLIGAMKEYDLYQYDAPPPAEPAVAQEKAA